MPDETRRQVYPAAQSHIRLSIALDKALRLNRLLNRRHEVVEFLNPQHADIAD